ncbi:MAG TPA: ABC transporter transmembrane domain-containing protein, partial [Alphaproteobacteria bacterium]|nr:ABC transporter transmembrane domain-containing protein [Alphaproteobacteria bacterium]
MISRIFPGLELIDRELPRDVKIPNKLWSFVWFFVRQVKWPFIAMFLCGIIANMALASEPWFYGQVSALLLKEIGVVEGKDEIFFSSLAGLCFAYIFVVHVFSRSIFSTMSRINNGTFIPFSMMIRRQLGQYLYGHSYRYFQDDYVGRLAGKVMEMPEAIRMILLNSCAHINYCIMQLIIAFVFFLSLDISFALVLMSYVIGCSFIIWWIIKFIGPASYRAIEDMNIVRGRYIDSISNMFLVKVFSRRRQEDLLIRDNLRQAGQSGRHKSLLGFWQEIFQHCCNASFQIALIFLVIHQFQTDVIEISDVVMILTFGIIVTSNSWW